MRFAVILGLITNAQATRRTNVVEHRDDRVLAFSGAFNGPLVFGYQVRAVTPGDFVLPAVSAECMYDPSLRAAKGAGRIKVEALK